MTTRKPIARALFVSLIKTRGTICENCKNDEFENIHHLDGDPTNNSFSNLMLLCFKCHKERHGWGHGLVKNIRISGHAYEHLARNVKYPESMADTLDRLLGLKEVKKK